MAIVSRFDDSCMNKPSCESIHHRKKDKQVIDWLRVGPFSEKLRPKVAFSRPRLQFFLIQTSQLANNINVL